MINFLKDVLAHSDDIAYGAGSELYNKMVVDTQDRHKKFSRWGNEVQNSLNLRKKELQAEERNYSTFLNNVKTKVDSEIESDMLSKGINLETYLAPLDSQLGTGLFLGEEKDVLPRIKYFLKNTPIKKDTPYVPSETYFKDNYAKLDNQMQHISGLGYNTWRALTKKGELSMVEDVKPVEFSKESMAKARHELTVNLENYDLLYFIGTPDSISQDAKDRLEEYIRLGGGLLLESPQNTGNINIIEDIETINVTSVNPLADDFAYWTETGQSHYIYTTDVKVSFLSEIQLSEFSSEWSILATDVQRENVGEANVSSIPTIAQIGSEFGISYICKMKYGLVMIEEEPNLGSESSSSSIDSSSSESESSSSMSESSSS